MGFKYRFAYYLVGFTVGCFFVALVFSGKDTRCNYFPNARVLNDLRSKPFVYSDKSQAILNQNWVTETDIKNTLTYGDVDFDKSNVDMSRGKLYCIIGKTAREQAIILKVINYSDKAELIDILKTKSN